MDNTGRRNGAEEHSRKEILAEPVHRVLVSPQPETGGLHQGAARSVLGWGGIFCRKITEVHV